MLFSSVFAGGIAIWSLVSASKKVNNKWNASLELFSSDKIDYAWYTAGTEYKINSNHTIDLYYRYQDEPSLNIIGVGYKCRF